MLNWFIRCSEEINNLTFKKIEWNAWCSNITRLGTTAILQIDGPPRRAPAANIDLILCMNKNAWWFYITRLGTMAIPQIDVSIFRRFPRLWACGENHIWKPHSVGGKNILEKNTFEKYMIIILKSTLTWALNQPSLKLKSAMYEGDGYERKTWCCDGIHPPKTHKPNPWNP